MDVYSKNVSVLYMIKFNTENQHIHYLYSGWTVSVEEGDTMVELSGGDFILDGLGEIELPPAFPVANKTRQLL